MKPLFYYVICLLPLLVVQPASGSVTLAQSWSGTLQVPDNNDIGVSNTLTVTAPDTTWIEAVTIHLQIEGGWNGDLFGYVAHDGQLAVLMNRPGNSLLNLSGAGSSGMDVTFSDLALADFHQALPDSGLATGTFQPDGRVTDPLTVLDTDPRTALLSVFNHGGTDGAWTLFLADQSPGDTSTLKSWSLTVTVVPEPSTAMMTGMAVMAMACARRRRAANRHLIRIDL